MFFVMIIWHYLNSWSIDYQMISNTRHKEWNDKKNYDMEKLGLLTSPHQSYSRLVKSLEMSGMNKTKTSKREMIIGISSLVILFDLGFWVLYLIIFTDYGDKYPDILAALAFILLNFMILPFVLLFAEIKEKRKKRNKTKGNLMEQIPTKKEKKKLTEYKLIINEKDKLKNEKCLICKLSIKQFEIIAKCPKCLTYFHKEHLDEWLVKKKQCPVCGTEIREI